MTTMMLRVPGWMPASAVADLAHLLAGTKPAVRIEVGHHARELRRWARCLGLFTSSDHDGFAAVSPVAATARRVLDLDRRPGRHTLALGIMLGYPVCCSRAAAKVGDEGIDSHHQAITARRFHGRFKGIDPTGYRKGGSLLSHVPCSHRCVASLLLAARAGPC